MEYSKNCGRRRNTGFHHWGISFLTEGIESQKVGTICVSVTVCNRDDSEMERRERRVEIRKGK